MTKEDMLGIIEKISTKQSPEHNVTLFSLVAGEDIKVIMPITVKDGKAFMVHRRKRGRPSKKDTRCYQGCVIIGTSMKEAKKDELVYIERR